MKSLFETGFSLGFHNNFGRLGQEEITGEPTVMPPEATISPTGTAEKKPAPSTDWGKLIAEGITGAAGAVTAYERTKAAEIAKETERLKQAAKPRAPGVPAVSGTSPILIAGLVGVGVIALGAIIMVAARG